MATWARVVGCTCIKIVGSADFVRSQVRCALDSAAARGRTMRWIWSLTVLLACSAGEDKTDDGAVLTDTDRFGIVDTEESEPDFPDEDNDGHDADEDCDDLNPLVNPDATEVCNGADDDCDGLVDARDEPFEGGLGPFFEDLDVDGVGAENTAR